MKDIYEVLKNLNIQYEEISHELVYTVEEAKKISENINGVGCKALFLKRKDDYYLLLLKEDKKADIKTVAKTVGVSKLSFANADSLEKIMGLQPGSVTPLGIINDCENKVFLIIDKELKGERLLLHPNTNSRTVSISYGDLIRFIEHERHSYMEI